MAILRAAHNPNPMRSAVARIALAATVSLSFSYRSLPTRIGLGIHFLRDRDVAAGSHR